MANFDLSIGIVLKHEGSFVNHPSDPGGATNKGITFNLFRNYADTLGMVKSIESLKTLTEDQAKVIYREEFWNAMRGDDWKDQQLANIVFDGFVNIGRRSIRMIQIEAGVPVDGFIGINSLQVINNANAKLLFQGYKDARIVFYKDLVERKPNQKVFLKGWLNRINSFTYQ